MSNKLINVIGIIVMTAWCVSFLLDAFRPAYEPPSAIHTAMLIVVGAAFTASTIRRSGHD